MKNKMSNWERYNRSYVTAAIPAGFTTLFLCQNETHNNLKVYLISIILILSFTFFFYHLSKLFGK